MVLAPSVNHGRRDRPGAVRRRRRERSYSPFDEPRSRVSGRVDRMLYFRFSWRLLRDGVEELPNRPMD